jgi:hypothetical protein
LVIPPGAPPFFRHAFPAAMGSPRPKGPGSAVIPAVIPRTETDRDPSGLVGSVNQDGPTTTEDNAFFQPLGLNGRTCASCHLPENGMSVSAAGVRDRFAKTQGRDPIFAPVDGADCPNRVPGSETSPSPYFGGRLGKGHDLRGAYSLLLARGVFRVFLPMPAGAEYTISVVSDPYTCNTDPSYALDPADRTTRIVSVYRRPLMSANLGLVTTTAPPAGPRGNIMWDGREPSLESQARDATFIHAQRDPAPAVQGDVPASALEEIVAFESGFFSAQISDKRARDLTDDGAKGGPLVLAGITPAVPATPVPTFDEFAAWAGSLSGPPPVAAQRASVARGEAIFNTREFTIANLAGFNDLPGIANPAPGQTCATCHDLPHGGSNFLRGNQRALGTAGDSPDFGGPVPSPDLPIFALTCAGNIGFHQKTTVQTNDPGLALITGKCADIGKFTVPPLRALAARAPYFHGGSAATLPDLVSAYNKRFSIGLSDQEKQDLANFLAAL